MKKASEVIMVIVLCLSFQINSGAQQNTVAVRAKNIEAYKIAVSFNKTSNIIFPYAIKSVDRGSPTILVQKAKYVENILQLKAAQQGFTSTNLSVVTADGKFYSFIVSYAVEPQPLNISFNRDSSNALLSDVLLNEAELDTLSNQVQFQHSFLHKKVKEQKMSLFLKGIYLSDSTMWFKLKLTNRSLIDYKPDNVRFFVRDRKRSKRTAVQENMVQPVYDQSAFVVNGNEDDDFIYGFTPFTIPSHQEFVIQVTEKNGGRALTMRVKHGIILKARVLEN